MKIVDYFEFSRPEILLSALRSCDWDAAKFLLDLLSKRTFEQTLGGRGNLFFLLDGEQVVSFLTLTKQDCVVAPDCFPWIGFVYTFPAYRGHRCAGLLLEHARKRAADDGHPFVFLATGHTGLYEKYGFEYLENRTDVYGESSRVYIARAADILPLADAAQDRARTVACAAGIRAAWESIGAVVNPVGSLPTGLLMKHRDIDFHIYTDTLDPEKSFLAISRICANPLVTSLKYSNLSATDEACFEWHAWYRAEDGEWQIDMIQILRGSRYDGFFEHVAERIKAVLTPETKRAILELKFLTPDSEHIMGIEYYQAVIADGVRTYPEFCAWRKAHPSEGIVIWCP